MTLHIITGALCSGKSTYVREHAKDGDVRVDFDALAQAFGSPVPHGSTGHVRSVTFAARKAAIRWLLENDADDLDAWIIHSSPAAWQVEAYEKAGAEVIHLDTDMQTCLERAESDGRPEGEAERIRAWFEAQGEKGVRMGDILTKSAELTAKDGGIVAGYAATFDREPDSYGDVIAKGAFADAVEAWHEKMADGIYPPLLYGHNVDDPGYNIGRVVEIREDDRGLYVEAELDPENERAQYVRKLVKEGRLYQFSFAFAVRDAGLVKLEDGTEAHELRKLDLFEVSLVQIPANQNAVVTGIKARRRNSAKGADVLASIAEHAREIDKAIASLLKERDETHEEEEPKGADADDGAVAERDAKKARILDIIASIETETA